MSRTANAYHLTVRSPAIRISIIATIGTSATSETGLAKKASSSKPVERNSAGKLIASSSTKKRLHTYNAAVRKNTIAVSGVNVRP